MGFFSRKSKASRDQVEGQSRASTDDRSMNRSSSARGVRGRTKEIVDGSGHPSSAPSSPRRFFSHSRNRSSSDRHYTTDPEAPPVPQPPAFQHEDVPVPPRNPRRNSNHSSSRQQNNPPASQQKVIEAGQSPLYYADSGYGSNGSFSAIHSRAPSEANYQEEAKQSTPHNVGALLPDLKLGNDNFGQSFIAEQDDTVPKADDSYFNRQISGAEHGNISPVDLEPEARPAKPSRASPYVSKRTRFEDTPDMPTLDQLQHFHCAPITNPAKHKPASTSADFGDNDLSAYVAANANAATIRDGFSLDLSSQQSEFSTKYMETPLPSSAVRKSAPPAPPLSILEGFKVNKKGRILDEEGEPIGELVEGDLLDCVRQKANANGEVIDDYGRVVGVVRTIRRDIDNMALSSDSTLLQQESRPAQSTQFVRPEPIRSLLAVRTNSTPALPISKQVAETKRIAQHNVHSHATEGSRSQALEQSDTAPVRVTRNISPIEHRQPTTDSQESLSEESPATQPSSALRDFAYQEQLKRPAVSRTSSERSLSELSKPYARPNMNPVPEDGVADEPRVPDSPGLYSFKGEIPADDRPQREARSRSPHVAINAKAALALGQPNSAMFASMGSGPYSHGGRMGPRRATTQFAGSYANGSLSTVPSNRPYKPSPLSSHETSPKRSDAEDSVSDDGRTYHRAPSVAPSMHSVTTINKPRTYFTHGGKVTVDPNAPIPAKPVESKTEAAPSATKEKTKEEKKKSRLSFGRRTVAK